MCEGSLRQSHGGGAIKARHLDDGLTVSQGAGSQEAEGVMSGKICCPELPSSLIDRRYVFQPRVYHVSETRLSRVITLTVLDVK
jgi:hypothetical protein